MILNHLWGLYSHPQDEWRNIVDSKETLIYSISHVLLIALVPTICSFFSAVYLGWHLSLAPSTKVPVFNAIGACVVLYLLLVFGTLILSLIVWRMAHFFDARPSFVHSLELAAYAATPMFMAGFAALYPQNWFLLLCGVAGLSYSIYLLFSGVPILIEIPADKRRTYTLSLVACGLVLLFSLLGVMVWVWQ